MLLVKSNCTVRSNFSVVEKSEINRMPKKEKKTLKKIHQECNFYFLTLISKKKICDENKRHAQCTDQCSFSSVQIFVPLKRKINVHKENNYLRVPYVAQSEGRRNGVTMVRLQRTDTFTSQEMVLPGNVRVNSWFSRPTITCVCQEI